ncbi:hypothetical protein F4779DRAFT_638470 [Xylariaceae sp. FL0662B]|nr:hypothetical protein F4779DRAFT_638470 [Xylariaceae sp. FL0662B]
MCFGNKDASNDPPPKPVQIPEPSSSSAPKPTASMPSQSHRQPEYAPPAGPPPSKNNPFFDHPPHGGPPSPTTDEYAPPPGPPPSSSNPQPKQHDWETAVPDTALLPPPPDYFGGFERSPANNATEEECAAGERWCAQFPLHAPLALDRAVVDALRCGNVSMLAPPAYQYAFTQAGLGVWRGDTTRAAASDSCFVSYPPLYHVAAHSPLATGRPKTIYYEVRVLGRGGRTGEVSLALGYAAPPYPPFRLPGWHRGSLGVHGDDGHRYVNDRWGGKAFTEPFRRGETLGLGMRFAPGADGGGGGIAVDVFFTRDGVERGRWDLHEESDRVEDLPVTGLEGFHDLAAAVGVFGRVAFEVVFAPDRWLWRGYDDEG